MSAARWVMKVLWIYSFLTLSIVVGVALVPSVLLVTTVAGLEEFVGVLLTGPEAGIAGQWLRALLLGVSLGAGFFVFGLSLGLVIVLMKHLLFLRSHEGEIPVPSFKLWTFYHYDGLLLFYSLVFMPFLRNHAVYPVFLRLMGAKIGKNTILNTNQIYDADLLEIGDDTLVGGNVVIIAHVVEARKLIRKRVRIGKNVTIGQFSSIFPGAQIGDNVTIGAHTLVLKDMVLPPNTVWGGVPARQLRTKEPKY